MSSSVDRWIHGEGRLGEPALREPAGGEPPVMAGPPAMVTRNRVCWRCGAVPFSSSPCTEKRGDGPPWRHAFLDRDLDHPWGDETLEGLFDLCVYFGGKARSSLITATAFADLVRFADELGISRARRADHRYARDLYRDKAAKRIRLFDWTLSEYERRLALEEVRDAPSHPDPG